MWTDRIRYQEEPIESYDSIFGDDPQEYINAASYAFRFRDLSKDEIYEEIKSIPLPSQDKLFRVQNGFNTDRQVALYFQVFNQMIQEGANVQDITERYIQMTLQDYEGFNFEFITRNPVLINWLERDETDIRAHRYNGVSLRDVVGTSERDGIYVDVFNELTKRVTKAAPGSTFVITSPEGWSETKESGKELKFPESQTYIYRIDENGEFKAITVRTDLNVEEHEQLMKRLSSNDFTPHPVYSDKEQLKHVSRYVASVGNMTFSEIVNAMQMVTNKTYAWTDKGKQKITFEELEEQVKNVHDLYSVDSTVQIILDRFRGEMMNFGPLTSDEDVQRLTKLLGQTALEISHAHRVKTEKVVYTSFSDERSNPGCMPPIDYAAEAQYVSVQPGCAMVSSGNAGWQNTALGVRLVAEELTPDKYGERTFPCPHAGCGKTNTRPYGELLEQCQFCKKDIPRC